MSEELILEIYWWLYVIRVRLQLNSKKRQRGMTYETSLKEEEINLLKEKGQNR